jgi:hypothetical protein
MASSTPTKSKTTSKSNTAKSTSLSKKQSFNPRVLIAIVCALVVTLGFIYVFFSKAATLGTWGADKLQVWHGTLTTKSTGAKQVSATKADDPVVGAWSSIKVVLTSYQTSNTVNPGTYCATGTAPAGSRISEAFGTYGQKGGSDGSAYDPTKSQAINNGAAGAFEVCAPLLPDMMGGYAYVGFSLYAPGITSTLVVDKIYQKNDVVTWYGDNITVFEGTKTTKSDLTRQIVGVLKSNQSEVVGTWNNINANISWPMYEGATYCAVGSAPAGSYSYSFAWYGEKGGGGDGPFNPKTDPSLRPLSTNSSGKYEICKTLAVRNAEERKYNYAPYFGLNIWAPTNSQLTLDYIYLKNDATPTQTPTPTPTATPVVTQAPATSAPTSTGTWTADKLLLVKGTLTTKADGAKQITSVKEGNWSVSHFSLDNVAPDTYCVSGTAPAGSYSQIIARYDELGRTVSDPAQLSPLTAGAFETCASLAARPADQPSAPSHVFVQIYSPATTPTTVDKMYIQSASTNPAPASSS